MKRFFADFKDFHFLRESNFLSPKLNFSNVSFKHSCFVLGQPRRVFHFFMLLFLQMFSGVFIFDCIWSLHCLLGTSFLGCCCCCTASATDLREHFLFSGVFYLTLLPNIWLNLLLSSLPWSWQLSLEGCRASH